jgi:DNA polymerase-1
VNKTLLAVDGMAFVYRAYYAIPPMSNRSGLHTNAVFGFARILQKMLAEVDPEYVVVAFDTKEPTFRHEQYKEYKAHRPPMPDDLVEQLPWIKEYVKTLNIACLEYPGYEADDVLATLAVQATGRGIHTLIATGDKDLCQLVNASIGILQAGFNSHDVYDAEAVVSRFGVRPDQIVDYLSLVGDSADNIPGVAGVGPKTAARLLQQYETLDNVFDHVGEMKGRLRERLELGRETVIRYKNLLKISIDVPVQEHLDDMQVKPPDTAKLNSLREYLDFRSPADGRTSTPPQKPQMELF